MFNFKTIGSQAAGLGLVLIMIGFSMNAAAQTSCAGSIGVTTDPNTFPPGQIEFTGYPLQEPVSISLNPAAGATSLPLVIDTVRFAVACANNGDEVPCVQANDAGDFNGEIPITFVGLDAVDPGTCGVTGVNVGEFGPGTVGFSFPPIALDTTGCTINLDVLVDDIGTDNTPFQLTPAADADGTCDVVGGTPIEGQAGGSGIIFLAIREIQLVKEISVDGGLTWFDANDAASAPLAAFPSGAQYRLTVTNTGTVSLVDVLINDPTLGIVDQNIGDLAPGESVVVDSGTIPALNQALVCDTNGTFENTASVQGTQAGAAPGTVSASDSDSANLVCVGIDVVKTADPLGKVGDVVDYQIDLINNSGVDLVNCTAVDSLLATGFGPAATLPVAGQVLNLSRAVAVDDPDPLINTVELTCIVDGPVNSVTLVASDDAETNLFQPSVEVVKTGPEVTKAGDAIDYTVTLTNTSSADTPAAINCTASDPLNNGGAPFALGFGAANAVGYSFTPEAGTTQVVNTVDVECTVDGFTNVFGDQDSHTADVIDPAITVTKTGPATAEIGDEIVYTIGFDDIGSGTLENCTGTDNVLGDLGAFVDGVPRDFNYTVQASDPNPLLNIATITCDVAGFDNQVSDFDTHTLTRFDVPETVPTLQAWALLLLASLTLMLALPALRKA